MVLYICEMMTKASNGQFYKTYEGKCKQHHCLLTAHEPNTQWTLISHLFMKTCRQMLSLLKWTKSVKSCLNTEVIHLTTSWKWVSLLMVPEWMLFSGWQVIEGMSGSLLMESWESPISEACLLAVTTESRWELMSRMGKPPLWRQHD